MLVPIDGLFSKKQNERRRCRGCWGIHEKVDGFWTKKHGGVMLRNDDAQQ